MLDRIRQVQGFQHFRQRRQGARFAVGLLLAIGILRDGGSFHLGEFDRRRGFVHRGGRGGGKGRAGVGMAAGSDQLVH
ncbi:hypothetical protein D9M69_648000 [compost metagenome]